MKETRHIVRKMTAVKCKFSARGGSVEQSPVPDCIIRWWREPLRFHPSLVVGDRTDWGAGEEVLITSGSDPENALPW